jgi:hypothetical protein
VVLLLYDGTRLRMDQCWLYVCGLLILQPPDVTWEGRLVGILAVGEGGLVSSETLLEGVWGESDVLIGSAQKNIFKNLMGQVLKKYK